MASPINKRGALSLALCAVMLAWCNPLPAAEPAAKSSAEGVAFFESKIRPALVKHCYECHSAATAEPKGGLRLDSRPAMLSGGESGPAVAPGKPDESLLLAALRHEGFEMPPGKRLPEPLVSDFLRWIEMGAPDPRDQAIEASEAAAQSWEAQFEDRSQWWSLQPVVEPPLPAIADGGAAGWPAHPIDRFLVARLQQDSLRPAPRADRPTRIRRLSYALTGLPPAIDEVERFAQDASPDAWERLVDRLLASPHFGERWARHWMDVVRYTDTYGYEWDMPAKGAWQYRDYLVRAFNGDVPIDQLLREQIAGDLLQPARVHEVEQINESLLGVMFFQMGEKRHGDSAEFDGIHQEMLDNKIDAFSKALQATTVACARCHDHKLDAVSQREYYALAGVFMSSRWVTNTADLPERNAAVIAELNELKRQLRAALAAAWQAELRGLAEQLLRASPTSPPVQKLQAEASGKEPPLESPLYVWRQLAAAAPDGIAAAWQATAARYAKERAARIEQNARDFVVVADFRQAAPEGWSIDGVGLREAVPCGDFTVSLEGAAAVGRILPGGLFTHSLSPRLNGALRTPRLSAFDKAHLSFEHCGGDFAAHRTVVDNAFLTERQAYLVEPKLSWLRLSTMPSMKERSVYLELATKTSNPNFPPRVGLGGACSEEQTRDPRSWFGVSRVVLHEVAAAPADELGRFASLLSSEAPQGLPEAARRLADWLGAAVAAWSEDRASPEDVWLLNWLLDQGLVANRSDLPEQPEVKDLVGRYRAMESRLEAPWTINGMADVDPGHDCQVYLRGDYDQPGPTAPRGYLRMLAGSQAEVQAAGSGRRELADLIASPENPLTARVFVNRVWQWLWGTGIVATPDDFGHLGEPPTHPELLDYLAARLMAEGWSLKRLVRSIALSEAWQQSSQASPEAIAIDPNNRLLSHWPVRRLEAEAIRDAMLSVSGRLDARLYGPPIDPHRQNEDPQKRLFSGPLDGQGRRSLYTKITIMEPPRLLATFNQPTPKIPTGRRDVTNTPAQSLAMLNDPFISEQAGEWAQALIDDGRTSVEDRLSQMFQSALSRQPTAAEIARWRGAVSDLAALHGVADSQILQSIELWRDVAHAMFNTQEFIYLP